jgi:alkylation response protein AidB-like acyl-CoA dehydrogenase
MESRMSKRVLADEGDLAALRESVAKMLSELCGSRALHAYIDGKNDLDAQLWTQAAELGWLAVALPEQYGGLGLGAQGLEVLHREIGRHLAPGPFIATLSFAHALADTAGDDIKNAWLPRIASGEVSAAVPVTFGTAAVGLFLGSTDASVALAPADGGWALIDLANLAVEPERFWDATRGVVRLNLAGAPAAAMLPVETGAALADAMALAVAADSVGGARAIALQTIEYMKTRQQFGRPIAAFQALKHRAADLVSLATTSDHILGHAVELAALGNVDAPAWAALAKAETADAYVTIADDCVLLHGGVGFTWEFDAHIFLKRARFNQMLIATGAEMRDRAAVGLATAARAGRTTLELVAA